MQHSQLRSINETVKLFAHKNPLNVVKTLKVLQYKLGVISDITPAYVVDDLNPGYYSTEILTPFESCYLLILFCGSPIVLRVGNPELAFLYHTKPSKTVPFTHYDEFGNELDAGNLIELQDGFYHHGPISQDLGYIQVLNRPYILSVPYADKSIQVAIAVVWSKKVILQKFGTKKSIINFKSSTTSVVDFKLNSIKNSFSTKVSKKRFINTIRKLSFKTIKC